MKKFLNAAIPQSDQSFHGYTSLRRFRVDGGSLSGSHPAVGDSGEGQPAFEERGEVAMEGTMHAISDTMPVEKRQDVEYRLVLQLSVTRKAPRFLLMFSKGDCSRMRTLQ